MVGSTATLFPSSGSVSAPATWAVLVIRPAAVGVTTSVTVARPPAASPPRLQTTTPVPLQLPWLATAEARVTLAGRVSVSTTPVASASSLLVTTRV